MRPGRPSPSPCTSLHALVSLFPAIPALSLYLYASPIFFLKNSSSGLHYWTNEKMRTAIEPGDQCPVAR
ncbi:MAG: hypothetical protein MZV63_45305 [Marinilabiliales bacterium]|nr:hypothetical protein [Marinilabiliales bacterium]